MHTLQARYRFDADTLAKQWCEYVDSEQHEVKAAEHEHGHSGTHLPDPENGFLVCVVLEAPAQLDHLAALLELRRYLACGQYRVNQEQRENYSHGRLRDEVHLELQREPVEAMRSGQDRTDEQHVAPHEQCEDQATAAAYQLIKELPRRRACRT